MVGGIMTGQIPRPFASIALVAAFLMAGVDIIVQVNPARADDCLAAPNSPTPPGSHWYYRLDRATQRKCWYVRALGSPAQQATASAIVGPATVRRSLPALPGHTPLADGAPVRLSSRDTTRPSPHPRMSAVKPIPAPVTRATVDDTVQQSVREENTASNAEVPAPQVSTSSKTSAQADTPPAVAWPDAPTAVAAVKEQQPVAMPTDARAYSVSYDAENTARGDAGMPMIIFPLVALGLAMVGIGWRIVVNNAAGPCARTIDDPEPDAVDNCEWRDDQYPHGSVIGGQELRSFISAVSDHGPVRGEDSAVQITPEVSRRRDKLARLRQGIERMLQSPASMYEELSTDQIAA